MKQADKVAAGIKESLKDSSKLPQKTSKPTALPINWISALFLKFNRRYPHKWSSAIDGDEQGFIEEWANGLAGVTGEQIKQGLESWNEDWPPSLIEFRNVCLGKVNGTNEFGLDYMPEVYRQKTLEKSKLLSSDERGINRDKAKEHIAKLKQSLKTTA